MPAELEFLKPAIESVVKQILEPMRGKLSEIEQSKTQMLSEAAAAETEATIKTFDVKYPEWKKHEAKMLEIGQKFIPTSGSMTDYEYMETLYNLATLSTSKAEQTKKAVERINKAASKVEPSTPGISEERVVVTSPADWAKMTNKERIRASWDAASRGQVFEK